MESSDPLFALDELLARVSEALRGLPGATELHFFGSAADPARKDGWSDLDLQVVTADFDLSRAVWPRFLGRVAEIELAYPILEKPRESAFWVVFKGQSFYHKIDIGLSQQGMEDGFLQQIERKVCLWRQEPAVNRDDPALPLPYMPVIGSPQHFLLGELMGSVRYLKARKRGQHLTCWRFLSAKLNALLRVYTWQIGETDFPKALNTWDFATLDQRLDESKRLALLASMNCRMPAEMDGALLDLTRRIVLRICPGCVDQDAPLASLTRAYLEFITAELG
jgi:hypothetical protein